MKKFTILISLFIIGFISFSAAQKLDYYITDYTDTLSSSQRNTLESIAENYANKTTNQIVTVIIPNRSGQELFDIGMKIFNENQIGNYENNGLLLLIALEEKKIRIIVGYGLEDEIPDLKASQLIEKHIRPFVNSNQLFDAIHNFYIQSQNLIDNSFIDSSQDYIRKTRLELIEFLIFIVFIFIIIFSKKKGKGGKTGSNVISFILGSMMDGFSGGGGRSGGGFGGFSGGGGRSGGGGAGD